MNQNHSSHSVADLFHLVPDIPESFLTESFEKSNRCREKIIFNQRISTLLPLIQSKKFQLSIYNKNKPAKQNVNKSLLFQEPIDALAIINPQQIQFITNLVNFISTNPETMIQAMQNILIQSVKKENSKIQRQEKYNDFLILCYSAIPSFFGFFSTNEHLNSAFSFFCTVVSSGTSNLNMKIVRNCLLPFYCNGCTYRFIEKVFDKFGTPFCHDPRFNVEVKTKGISIPAFSENKNGDKIMSLFRDEYLKSFIDSIIESYPLLPQPHQFLIKFMKVRGWTNENVIEFFIHDFVLTQILSMLKSTPFSMHCHHFSSFFIKLVDSEIKNHVNFQNIFGPLLNLFLNAKSYFEVPSAYNVFDLYYMQILTTTSDVKIILDSIIESSKLNNSMTKIPESLKQFITTANINQTSYSPFWVRLYSRKPKIMNSFFNWRPVVFPMVEIDDKKETIETNSASGQVNETAEYNKNSRIFERYLVHQMANIELQNYFKITEAYFKSIILPLCYETILAKINDKKFFSSNQQSVSILLKECMYGTHSCQIMQLLYMTIVKTIIPTVIKSSYMNKLQLFESKWQIHLGEIRQGIKSELPDIFKYKKGNEKTALLLHKQLWSAIDHLRCLQRISFEFSFNLIIDSLILLDDLLINDEQNTVIQYVIVISDCTAIISRFLFINSFVVKQKIFNVISSNSDIEKKLWSGLEIAIIKLLNRNKILLNEFMSLQDELISFPFSFCSHEFKDN